MAGRSAAKRTTPRRTSGGQREGRANQVGSENTTVTSDGGSSGGGTSGGGSSGGGSDGGGKGPSIGPKGSGGSGKGPISGTKSSGSKGGGEGRLDQIRKFLGQVRVEAGRVTWPTKIELAQATKVVLWTLFVFMIYLGCLDWLFIKIFNWGQHRYR